MRTPTASIFEDPWSGRTLRPPVERPRPAGVPRLIRYEDGTGAAAGGGAQPGTGGGVEGISAPGTAPGTAPVAGDAKPCGCD